MKKAAKIQRYLCCALGIICFLYYLLCGFYGGFHISILWIWIAAGIGFVLAGTAGAAPFKTRRTAYEYLTENPKTKAVASGGQGAGEEISEAACIAGELIKRGISPERIYLEDRSTTTAENMRFSYEIIGYADERVGIVTSDFHVYRSLCTARKAGFSEVYGIAAPYSKILRIHYAVREFAAFMVDYCLGNISLMAAPGKQALFFYLESFKKMLNFVS